MQTKFIEATDGGGFNWGKFAVCRFTDIVVLDLQTCEGAIFSPGGYAKNDLNGKHQIWVCPMYEPFLTWLYTQDLSDLDALPSLVDLGDVPTAMRGYRRTGARVTP